MSEQCSNFSRKHVLSHLCKVNRHPSYAHHHSVLSAGVIILASHLPVFLGHIRLFLAQNSFKKNRTITKALRFLDEFTWKCLRVGRWTNFRFQLIWSRLIFGEQVYHWMEAFLPEGDRASVYGVGALQNLASQAASRKSLCKGYFCWCSSPIIQHRPWKLQCFAQVMAQMQYSLRSQKTCAAILGLTRVGPKSGTCPNC